MNFNLTVAIDAFNLTVALDALSIFQSLSDVLASLCPKGY